MQLNENQKKAVEYLEGPLLVLAGPGTGKTQLLSQKVAYILKNTDTNPENILCVTFTDSGAVNMRERLKTIIGNDALRVNIGTYHVFGTDILAQYKNYSPDYDRRLDSPIDEVTQYKIVRKIQTDLPGTDILHGDNVKDIISVISSAKSAGLTPNDLAAIAKQNFEDSEVLSKTISPYLLNVVPRAYKESYEKAYAPIYSILKEYTNAGFIVKKIERSIGALARDLETAINEATATQKIAPLTKWRDSYFEKTERGDYRLKDRIANMKLDSVARVMASYEEYLRENGLYDFDDMIQEAVKALNTDEGFRLTMQEKYQFIMLDEFQDTNPSQLAIVKALTNYEKPMIMAVGDDDQAIYEFQGAMSSIMTDFRDYYHAEVITLTENYRSTQEILDFSREIIKQNPGRFDKELTAHRPAPVESQVKRYEFNSADAEYGFVADKIAELIDSGVKQNEIAVISYKTKYFEPILPYLKSHKNIKIAYEKRDDLFLNDKIHELLTLAQYIYEIANEKRPTVQLMEVLSYPFFHVPPIDIVREIGRARTEQKSVVDVLATTDNAQIQSAMNFLAGEVAKSYTEPLDVILYDIVSKMEIDGLPEYEKLEFYENLAALKGKVAKHTAGNSTKLADLVQMVQDYQDADMELSVANPYKDADVAVQIMSAHKAKGLEFEYVFMISADHVAWGKGKGNNNLLALPKNVQQIRHTGVTDGERLRIIYVTLTRAKKGLYITNSLNDFNGKSPERLEYFGEYVDGTEVVSPYLPNKHVDLMYDVAAPEVLEDNLRNWITPYLIKSPDMRAIYLERAKGVKMSASALTSFIDVVYVGPMEFFKSYILKVPQGPETEALAFGDLIHKTFEAVTKAQLDDAAAIQFFNDEIGKKDLETDVARKVRERGPKNLEIALAKFRPILEQGKAEVDFWSDHIVVNGVPVTGKIDHIVVDEQNKTIEVYDFKTGGYHKEKWASHATLFKYMLQLEFYKMLLNHSREYSKYKVEKAHILFVTPDKDGEVYDKEYIYNNDEYAEFLKLLSAVHHEMTTLEFMDDERVFVAPDEQKKLKDIKDFIALLLDKNATK